MQTHGPSFAYFKRYDVSVSLCLSSPGPYTICTHTSIEIYLGKIFDRGGKCDHFFFGRDVRMAAISKASTEMKDFWNCSVRTPVLSLSAKITKI